MIKYQNNQIYVSRYSILTKYKKISYHGLLKTHQPRFANRGAGFIIFKNFKKSRQGVGWEPIGHELVIFFCFFVVGGPRGHKLR